MASWGEFCEQAPEIASVGVLLLERHHLAYVATVRADGAPRVHPVSPFILAGQLMVATPRTSPKGRDQIRTGRYMLHFLPGEDDAEFSIRGTVRAIDDAAERAGILRDGPHWVQHDDWYFVYEIQEAASAFWVKVGQPGTYPVRARWHAPRAE